MVFGKRNALQQAMQNVKLKIGDDIIPVTETARNLGLILDQKLRFKQHVSSCLQKAYNNLRQIFHNRHLFNYQSKVTLCNSLVLSKVDFCDSVYGPCLDSRDCNRIQKLQNACLRLIFGIKKYERISHTLKEVKWLNMSNRRYLHAACLFHKILLYKAPPYLYDRITFRTDVHNLNLRFKGVTIPLHYTEFGKRGFSYQFAKFYNELPLDLKTMSVPRFRNQLKILLKRRQGIL